MKIDQGNQKLRQFEYQDFSSFFGRATLYKCITAECEMWHQNAWFYADFLTYKVITSRYSIRSPQYFQSTFVTYTATT